jgi:agmatinase
MVGAPDDTMWNGLLHSGVAGTFLRAPHVPPLNAALVQSKATAAILGFPWDSTTISRTGSNLGPRAIRAASSQFLSYTLPRDLDLRDIVSLVDCGDVPVVPGDLVGTMNAAEAAVGEILDAGAMPIILGGEHSVTIAGVRAFARRHPGAGLLLIDSHLDTADNVGGVTLSHCSPIARAIEAGFDPKKTVIVGPSGWLNPKSEYQYCLDHGISVIWLEDILADGLAATRAKIRSILAPATEIYLTVDIDALDLSQAPGTCVPTAGGMMLRELMAILHGLAGLTVNAADVVEVAPALDPAGSTQMVAARIVLETLLTRFG